MIEPSAETFRLPLSVFPSALTMDLIDKALAGENLVETSLYDGDNEAGKMLTTTATITPRETGASTGRTENDPSPVPAMRDVRRWRVSESHHNSDSDAEGLPLLETSYSLYENGVSDDLTVDDADYAFSGSS